jgi:hypothetical protein
LGSTQLERLKVKVLQEVPIDPLHKSKDKN